MFLRIIFQFQPEPLIKGYYDVVKGSLHWVN